jgi:hypothetical protein
LKGHKHKDTQVSLTFSRGGKNPLIINIVALHPKYSSIFFLIGFHSLILSLVTVTVFHCQDGCVAKEYKWSKQEMTSYFENV